MFGGLAEEHGGVEKWEWRVIEVGEWRGRVGDEANQLEQMSDESQRDEPSTERILKGLPSDLPGVRGEDPRSGLYHPGRRTLVTYPLPFFTYHSGARTQYCR